MPAYLVALQHCMAAPRFNNGAALRASDASVGDLPARRGRGLR
jgi:hypothetical protein